MAFPTLERLQVVTVQAEEREGCGARKGEIKQAWDHLLGKSSGCDCSHVSVERTGSQWLRS